MIAVHLEIRIDSKHRNVGFTTGSVVRTPFVLPSSATGEANLIASPPDAAWSSAHYVIGAHYDTVPGTPWSYPISVSSSLLGGYDDPEILPYSISDSCLIGADGTHPPGKREPIPHGRARASEKLSGRPPLLIEQDTRQPQDDLWEEDKKKHGSFLLG